MTTTHGMSKSAEYRIWLGMVGRCHNPQNCNWDGYGAQGIRVCKKWRKSFAAFLEDMGERPGYGWSIDRIDNDGDYTPNNCRWADSATQARNKSTNVVLTLRGKRLCIMDWALYLGVSPFTLYTRHRQGWDDVSILTIPIRNKRNSMHLQTKMTYRRKLRRPVS